MAKRRDISIFAGKSPCNFESLALNLHKFLLFFSSDAKNMAVDVRNILTKILSTKGNMSEADAVQYLKKMEAQKRYSADVWS